MAGKKNKNRKGLAPTTATIETVDPIVEAESPTKKRRKRNKNKKRVQEDEEEAIVLDTTPLKFKLGASL